MSSEPEAPPPWMTTALKVPAPSPPPDDFTGGLSRAREEDVTGEEDPEVGLPDFARDGERGWRKVE